MTVPLRKLLTSFVLMLVVTLPAAAQFGQPQSSKSVFPPQDLADMKRLQQAALSDDYAWNQLAHLTDNIGPRPAGSAQAQAAAEYVAAEMRKLGLEVQLEKCTVPHWVRGRETGELVELPGMAPGTAQKIVLTALGNSVATPPEGITADVIAVRKAALTVPLGDRGMWRRKPSEHRDDRGGSCASYQPGAAEHRVVHVGRDGNHLTHRRNVDRHRFP